jgi:hypothetical protein
MKSLLTILCLLSISANAVDNNLLKAIEQVESGGNVRAVGDNGKSYGCLQIWNVVITDVNRIASTKFNHDDAFNRNKAYKIAKIYLNYYGNVYRRKTGKQPNNEVYARIWNGGPNGWRKLATVKYWEKVKAKVREVNNGNTATIY